MATSTSLDLNQALMKLASPLPWIERLDTTPLMIAPDVTHNSNSDFAREFQFYSLAQAAVNQSLDKLQAMEMRTCRPSDYFAEMVKPDKQMEFIREKLLSEHFKAEHSLKMKKRREEQKYSKKTRSEALLKRNKDKKEFLASIEKQRKKKGGDYSFLESKNPKREYKNKRYGFGGQKKRSKRNNEKKISK